VGIIIGAAFGKIVGSVVEDVLMPPLGLLMGGVDFSDKVLILKEATLTAPATPLETSATMIGSRHSSPN